MSKSNKYNLNIIPTEVEKFSLLVTLKYVVLLLLILPTTIFAQLTEHDKNTIIEKRVEYLIEDAEDSDADYTTIFDQPSYYFDHPLNLNRAELSELEGLSLLTSIQIN